jgi:hypothetical protein
MVEMGYDDSNWSTFRTETGFSRLFIVQGYKLSFAYGRRETQHSYARFSS